jgi:hypothetical protein
VRPVGVVDEHGPRRTWREIEEAQELRANAGDVGRQLLVAEQIALGALAGRIADQACGRRAAIALA